MILGIDLGTTYSLGAVMRGDEPVVIPNALGELLTPSVVTILDGGECLVGALAQANAARYPERTFSCFKRDMGTDRVHRIDGRAYTPVDLSAMVLGSIKADAEAALGHPVDEAVITVPAYFGENQRRATRAAGELAGFTVDRIINEPTAAALAYGLNQLHREVVAVVIDAGGGTFDVSVVDVMEGVIEIRASAGDARLGGEDFTDATVAEVIARIRRAHGVDVAAAATPASVAVLRQACDRAKRRLSHTDQTVVSIPSLALRDGAVLDVEIPLDRETMEAAWIPIIHRMRGPIWQALRDAHLSPADVEEVLMVGGATRTPAILRMASEVFGRLPRRDLPPDETVARGAAVQAGLKAGDHAVSEVVVTDVAPFSLGVETMDLVVGADPAV